MAVLSQLGLPFSGIGVSRSASSLTIAIPQASACTATPADEQRIKTVLRRLLPFAKKVGVTVSGTGQPLGQYVSKHCKPRRIPSGSGRVIFDKGGAGFVTSPPVKVTAKHWTIAFDSEAAFFQVAVTRQDGTKVGNINSRGRGVGQKTFAGPGTFRLKISSPATWRIQVRNGG
jgi:hypothetical protein